MKKIILLFLAILILCLALSRVAIFFGSILSIQYGGLPLLSGGNHSILLIPPILILSQSAFIIFSLGALLFYRLTKSSSRQNILKKLLIGVLLIASFFASPYSGSYSFYTQSDPTNIEANIGAFRDKINNCHVRDGINRYERAFVSIYEEYYCKDGKRNGPFKEFTKETKILLSEGNNVNNKKDGLVKNYRDGKLYSELTYQNGLLNGPFVDYYVNGQIASIGSVKNDPTDVEDEHYYNGSYKLYNEKGVLIEEGTYIEGKKNGLFKYFDSNGKLETTITY